MTIYTDEIITSSLIIEYTLTIMFNITYLTSITKCNIRNPIIITLSKIFTYANATSLFQFETSYRTFILVNIHRYIITHTFSRIATNLIWKTKAIGLCRCAFVCITFFSNVIRITYTLLLITECHVGAITRGLTYHIN